MVISGVRCNDLMEPLKKLAIERQKLKGKGVNRSHSLYWDILFLAFTVMGRENIDHGKEMYGSLSGVKQLERKAYTHSYSLSAEITMCVKKTYVHSPCTSSWHSTLVQAEQYLSVLDLKFPWQ